MWSTLKTRIILWNFFILHNYKFLHKIKEISTLQIAEQQSGKQLDIFNSTYTKAFPECKLIFHVSNPKCVFLLLCKAFHVPQTEIVPVYITAFHHFTWMYFVWQGLASVEVSAQRKAGENLHIVPVLWMVQSQRQMYCTRSSAKGTCNHQTLFLQHLTSILSKDCCITGASSLYHKQQHETSPHRQDGECSDSCISERKCHQEVAFTLIRWM